MGYRTEAIIPGNIYHVYTRGVNKENIFRAANDRKRFRQLLVYYMHPGEIPSFSSINKISETSKKEELIKKTVRSKGLVDLLCYCLMDTHFHLLLYENTERGIVTYMRRILNSYAKYFNTKYDRHGPLFAERFRAKLVERDEYFLHVSRYIHLNPFIAGIIEDPTQYEWSSLPEYMNKKQRSLYCHTELLNEIMKTNEHKNFVIDYAGFARNLEMIKHLMFD